MIFTRCLSCEEPKNIHYESGDATSGKAERWECEKCGAIHFSEHISFGETMSEEEFWKRHPEANEL